MKNKLMVAMFGVAVLAAAALGLAATINSDVGARQDYVCSLPTDPIASQAAKLTACSFDAPCGMEILSAQVYCATETSTAKVFSIKEGASVIGTASLDVADDPVFFTMTDTVVADEAQVRVIYDSDAGESATDCAVVISAQPCS